VLDSLHWHGGILASSNQQSAFSLQQSAKSIYRKGRKSGKQIREANQGSKSGKQIRKANQISFSFAPFASVAVKFPG